MHWKITLILAAGTLFCISAAGYIFVKIALRPKDGSDLDEYHYELEDHCPELARYEKWSRITFVGTITGMLLLFLAAVL
ncbi:MAG: hypothetical protein ACYSUT_11435 [Planctomycetota bacterium]|jgi:putative effector of murein hydrolase LrgA (UPF0299 family)